ncbi:MAG: hypothetical protein LUE96_08180 [Lachnospiraceae bacterium]|nr:hypothetical protein [Lachnospiraceae bacterium]
MDEEIRDESQDLLLMMKDTEVLRVNFDEGIYEVCNEQLLPYLIKGRLQKIPEPSAGMTKYEITQMNRAMMANYNAVIGFLANRVLPLSRANAKKIYQLFKLEQVQSPQEKAKIAILCRAVSLQDNYWLKLGSDKTKWSDVDLRTNSLSEVVAQIALHGTSLSFEGSFNTPELTNQGAYAKAWKREEDGVLWLYKRGAKDATEARIEVMVSDILDKCNVEHVHYEKRVDSDEYCCACPCITTEEMSILPGMDFVSYCNVNGLNPDVEMMRIDADAIYKMWIVDYLISNRDRHGLNWGFYINSDTNGILKCHPLFDHNNSFDNDYMQNADAPYQFCGMTIRQAAQRAVKHVDFHFTAPITREDFITDRQYQSFMSRADELGIQTILEQQA